MQRYHIHNTEHHNRASVSPGMDTVASSGSTGIRIPVSIMIEPRRARSMYSIDVNH